MAEAILGAHDPRRRDFARHVDYIHYNPVKHGLAKDSFDWRWSSIHAYAKKGLIAAEWRGREQDGRFGD